GCRRLQRSTRGSTGGQPSPCSTLLPMGFTEPPGSPRALVRSYRTVSPLPVPEGHRRSALCCTVLRVAPTGCYPASCPVESGRSSDRCCTQPGTRPPGRLAAATSLRRARCRRRRRLPSRGPPREPAADHAERARDDEVPED